MFCSEPRDDMSGETESAYLFYIQAHFSCALHPERVTLFTTERRVESQRRAHLMHKVILADLCCSRDFIYRERAPGSKACAPRQSQYPPSRVHGHALHQR